MTDQAPGHGRFDELAAGYALDALEPADEQLFLEHAAHCPPCARTLADYREVAAALADTAPPAEPRPRLADRVMAVALAGPDTGLPAAAGPAGTASEPGVAGGWDDEVTARDAGVSAREDGGAAARSGEPTPPAVVPLRPRSRRWLRPALAAVAVLIAGGGIWGGLAATTGSGTAQPPIASCGPARGCTQVILTASATHAETAKVIIHSGEVWMIPAHLPPDDPADQIYVLWQITGNHVPVAVGSFDVRAGAHAPIKIGGLAAPYSSTLAFAVSLEHGRAIPAVPSRPVALGDVS